MNCSFLVTDSFQLKLYNRLSTQLETLLMTNLFLGSDQFGSMKHEIENGFENGLGTPPHKLAF